MKDALDFIKDLKPPTIFRDVNYILIGSLLLYISALLFQDKIDLSFFFFGASSDVQKFFFFAVFAYFFARCCSGLGIFVTNLSTFVFSSNKKIKINRFFSQLKEVSNSESYPLGPRQEMNALEVQNFIYKSIGLSSFFERMGILNTQEKAALGFSVILSISYSLWFFLPTLVFLLISIRNEIERWDMNKEAYHYLWLDAQKKDIK